MDEKSSAYSRRRVLGQGALAAGVVWSAPALRSVRVLQATGSPSPGSTSTTPTSVSEPPLQFSGALHGPSTGADETNGCFPTVFELTGDLVNLGIATFTIGFCANPQPPDFFFHVDDGTVAVQTPTGAFSGTMSGDVGPGGINGSQILFPVQFTFAITSGSGAYANASGSATFDGLFRFPLTVDGTVEGSLTFA